MTTLTAAAVEPEQIGRLNIKEVVEGIPVTIEAAKSALVMTDGEQAVTLSVDTTSEDAAEFLKPFHETMKGWASPFKTMKITAIWLDPNPLGVAPFMVDEVRCTNDQDQAGVLFYDTLQNMCASVGWMAPLLSAMPTAMLKALFDKDEDTVAVMRDKISKMPSLIRETSYAPAFKAVLMPYTEEEEGLEWDIS